MTGLEVALACMVVSWALALVPAAVGLIVVAVSTLKGGAL